MHLPGALPQQHGGFDAMVVGKHEGRHVGARADAVVPQPGPVDVRPGFEVVDRPAEVLHVHDVLIAILAQASSLDPPIEGPAIDRVQHGAAALYQELHLSRLEVRGRSGRERLTRGEEHHRLERRRGIPRQEEIGGNAILAVGRVDGDFLPPPVRRVV